LNEDLYKTSVGFIIILLKEMYLITVI